MTKESTNTSQFQLLPEGHYTFKVKGRPEKKRTAKASYRIWKLSYVLGQSISTFSTIMFPWLSKELLLALGGTINPENSEVVDWDDEQVTGKTFECDIVHVERDKDGEKIKSESLRNIKAVVVAETSGQAQTDAPPPIEAPAGEGPAVAWDE